MDLILVQLDPFRLLQSYISTESSEDLQTKSKKALKNILQKCVYLPALEPLLHDAPSNILKHVVAQYSKVGQVHTNCLFVNHALKW